MDPGKDFRGKAKMLETGIRAKCVTLLIDGPTPTPGKEALIHDGRRSGA